MARRSSKKVVYAALLGNVLVALTKFAAAALTFVRSFLNVLIALLLSEDDYTA